MSMATLVLIFHYRVNMLSFSKREGATKVINKCFDGRFNQLMLPEIYIAKNLQRL